MKSYIFKNAGVIDPRAIATFGVSSKEGASPIGFFGTGLKYAVGVRLELTYCSFPHKYRNVVRTIVSRNSRGIGFGNVIGQKEASWLNIFSGQDTLEFSPDKHNSFRIIDQFGSILEYRIYD